MSATPGSNGNRAEGNGADGNRSELREPEDLKRKADEIRADLDRTLNELERKLSPKQLLNRSLNYMNANGGDMLESLGAAVRKNPVPLLMTSAGLIWLAAASRDSRTTRFDRPSASPRTGDFDRSSQSFDRFSRSDDMSARLKHRARRTLSATREQTSDFGRNLNDMIQEQPLVCGAIAIAVGAIVGAALPESNYERGLLARARDSAEPMLDRASEASEDMKRDSH